MANVIIFGTKDFAQLAYYYLRNDSEHEVIGFCVNEKFLEGRTEFEGRPLICFEDMEGNYPPGEYKLFAPMSPKGMNKLRAEIYNKIKQKGYECISYISSKAVTFDNEIGENCFILENNTIQPYTNIGNNVIMWSGNHIGHHGLVKDHVFFSSQVVMSGHCTIEPFCYFGVNSCLRDGIKLGKGTMVGMGAVILNDTEPCSIYMGNPARVTGKVTTETNI